MILLIAAALASAAAPPARHCPELVTPEAMICRAIEAQADDKPDVAAQSFEEAANASSDKDPATARMLAAAGNMWLVAGQPGKAALDLDRAQHLNRTFPPTADRTVPRSCDQPVRNPSTTTRC